MLKKSIITGLLLLVFALLLFYLYLYNLEDRIPPDTFLNKVNISGMTLNEVEKELNKQVDEFKKKTIVFKDDRNHPITYDELGMKLNDNDVLNEISVTIPYSIKEKFKIYFLKENEKREFFTHAIFNEKQLEEIISNKFSKILKEPKDATYIMNGNEIIINNEVYGERIGIEELIKMTKQGIKDGSASVNIPIERIKPNKTKKDIEAMGLNTVIATFVTYFDRDNVGRNTNIKLSADAINGTMLAPNEIFDFNKVVGQRTKERGYQEANVIENGQFVKGIGGGICQTSTTLYNAVLLANLEVIERHQHGLPVGYIEPSRDASVSWGYLNFKFRNNMSTYVYITTEVGKDYIRFNIVGTEDNKEVYLESKVIGSINPSIEYEKDDSLEVGTEVVKKRGTKGIKSQLYKIIKENGEVVYRDLISTDTYKSTKTIIRNNPE